jgi:rubrerythrin
MFSIKDIIDIAIQIERNGESVYRNAIQNISNPELVALLQWLADQELEHIEWFDKLKQTAAEDVNASEVEKMGRALLRDAVGAQNFALKEADFTDIDQVEDLIKLAIEFEKDTALFYEMLEPFIEDPDILYQLAAIIAEENRHAQVLEEYLKGEIPG